MFTETAKYYDLIYSVMKDYRAEARKVHKIIQSRSPSAATLLDVGCGTGEHAKWLRQDFGYEIEGIDLDPNLICIAAEKTSECRFHVASMTEIRLGRKFDSAVCLFGAIGYLTDLEDFDRALSNIAQHLISGGTFLLEPFLPPDQFVDGLVFMDTVDHENLKISRMATSSRTENICQIHFEYLVGTPSGMERMSETHTMRLYNVEETMTALSNAGFIAEHRADDLCDRKRGLYICTKQ